MNSRYLAYCAAHGRTPDEQAAADGEKYPGGKMTGFLLWMSARLSEYSTHLGLHRSSMEFHTAVGYPPGSDVFDAWLMKKATPSTPPTPTTEATP